MHEFLVPDHLIEVINRYPKLGEIIRFGYALYMELKNIRPNLVLTSLKLSSEQAVKMLKDGFPLVEKSRIELPSDQFSDTFHKVSFFIAEQRQPLKSKILEILKNVKDQNVDLQKLVQLNLKKGPDQRLEPNHNEQNNNHAILDLLIKISLKPFGRAYGTALASYLPSQDDSWLQPYCPICGSSPLLAYIKGEEGRRYLLCSWCDTPWTFQRIRCPSCQNMDQKNLSYFRLENDTKEKERDWISVCKKCKKYIKTLDFRNRLVEDDLWIKDLATLHLDLLAEREGYERITRHILSF
jgi:FdhE protein